jgi:hypothetical protein
VDGEFFNAEELDTLTAPIHHAVERSFFTLQLSDDRNLERVQGDPLRGGSKNPSFLAWLHAQFVQALPFLQEQSIVITTDALTLDQVVARMRAAMECPSG